VFFFDEAHLLFDDAPQALRRAHRAGGALIRSKGVGVYFCTQNPDRHARRVLGQLGNRVQHALRAFTPRDQKAVKAAAETFRAEPEARPPRSSPSSASARRWSRHCRQGRAVRRSSAPDRPAALPHRRRSPTPSAARAIALRSAASTTPCVDRESACEKCSPSARAGRGPGRR
jgi:hypothetical protein